MERTGLLTVVLELERKGRQGAQTSRWLTRSLAIQLGVVFCFTITNLFLEIKTSESHRKKTDTVAL